MLKKVTLPTLLSTLALLAAVKAIDISIGSLGISYSGAGCPQGSVTTQGDGPTDNCGGKPCAGTYPAFAVSKILTQNFDSFNIYWGPGVRVSDRAKQCQTRLTYTFGGKCAQLVVNNDGMDARGYTLQRLSNVNITTAVTYYISEDAGTTARNTLAFPDGASGTEIELGYTGLKHAYGDLNNTLRTKCHSGGSLNMHYRIAATDKCPTCGEIGTPDNSETAGRWYFQHSLSAIECECT